MAYGAPAGRSPLKMIWARRPSAMAMEKKSCARIWGGSCHRGGGGEGGERARLRGGAPLSRLTRRGLTRER